MKCLTGIKLFSRSVVSRNFTRSVQTQSKEEPKYTHYGFELVTENERRQKVHKLFEEVADTYDIMNDVMSLGIHRIWKDILMHRLSPTKGTHLLDAAGGTGDIAFRFLNYIINSRCQEDCHVTVCDINTHMLEVGKSKGEALGYDPKFITWKKEDAENLSFADESFNAYTIAFGVQNITGVDKVLKEAYRVLKPGGRFLCLEFGQMENCAAQWLYDQYSFQVIPVLGHLVTGKWHPYKYVAESTHQFPNQETFKSMIEAAGFRQVTYENLTLGMVAIHSAFKL